MRFHSANECSSIENEDSSLEKMRIFGATRWRCANGSELQHKCHLFLEFCIENVGELPLKMTIFY